MVFWIRSVILVIVLHGCVASRYYYKEKNGNYDVYYGPSGQWGYKEMRPPKSFKISYGDRGDRPGKCFLGEFNCDSPYPIAKTKFFECDADYQCPRFFKCCKNPCFQHRICQPIDTDASEDNEIPTDGSITESTSEVSITQGPFMTSSPATQSDTHSSTDGSLPSKGTEETTQNTLSTQYTDKSTTGGTDNTQSTSTDSSPSTSGKITYTEQESSTVIISSSSIFPSTTTSKATQPSTSHSIQFTTTEGSVPTTITRTSTDMSTVSSTVVGDVTSTIEQSTTRGDKYIQSTTPISDQSSTYSEEPSTTATVYHPSSITFPIVSTSKDTQPPTQHSSKFTTTEDIETTTAAYVPTYISTVSSTTRQDGTSTSAETSTRHTSESTTMKNTDTESTTPTSTGYSTISDRITHTDEWSSSTTTFPSTITSTVTQSSSRESTKLSTERTETTASVSTTTTPFSSDQEKGKTAEKTTQYISEPTTTVSNTHIQTSTTETPTTPYTMTITEKVSSTAMVTTDHPSYTTTSEVTPSTSHNVIITHLPSYVFTTDKQDGITTQREASSSQQTSQNIEVKTTKQKHTNDKTTGTTQIPESSTANKIYSTITQVTSTTESTLLTTISADIGKDTSGTVSPSHTTISSSETQPPTSSIKHETTESSTESITVKETTKLLTDTTLKFTTHPTAPEATTVVDMSSNTITSSSIASDETKPNTKYFSSTTQSTDSHGTSPISTTHNPTLQSKSTAKYLGDTSTSLTFTTHSTPEATTVVDMSSNAITSSSIASDETKPNTKYLSSTTQSTDSHGTSPISTNPTLQSKSTATSLGDTSTSLKFTTHPTPEATTVVDMSSNAITSSSIASDETKPNTKYLSSTTQSTDSHGTSPISTNPTLQSKSTATSLGDTSTSPSSSRTSTDSMPTSPPNPSTISSKSIELTTTSPVDHRTVQSSLITGKGTTFMVGITSDDEDLIFSGDYEPSTRNSELLASATTNTETTKKILDSVTSQTTKGGQTSKAVSNKFDDITSSISDITTATTFSKQTPGTSTEKITTLKSVTDKKIMLATDDEDLTFSGDGEWQATNDRSILEKLTTTSSHVTKDVPQSFRKDISSDEKLKNTAFSTSSTIEPIIKDHSTINLLDRFNTASSDKDLTSRDDTGLSILMSVTERFTTFKDLTNMQTSDFTYDSPLISSITSTPMKMSSKATETSTFKESNDFITFSPDRLTSIAKDKKITVDDTVLTPLPESQYPSDKVYVVDRLLGTIRKLPSIPERARNVGDNYSFSNFLGFLDNISDLLGKINDKTLNELDDQKSTTISEKDSVHTSGQELMQSTTEKKYTRQIVEVEN